MTMCTFRVLMIRSLNFRVVLNCNSARKLSAACAIVHSSKCFSFSEIFPKKKSLGTWILNSNSQETKSCFFANFDGFRRCQPKVWNRFEKAIHFAIISVVQKLFGWKHVLRSKTLLICSAAYANKSNENQKRLEFQPCREPYFTIWMF